MDWSLDYSSTTVCECSLEEYILFLFQYTHVKPKEATESSWMQIKLFLSLLTQMKPNTSHIQYMVPVMLFSMLTISNNCGIFRQGGYSNHILTIYTIKSLHLIGVDWRTAFLVTHRPGNLELHDWTMRHDGRLLPFFSHYNMHHVMNWR